MTRARQPSSALLPLRARGRRRASFEVGEGRVVGRDHSGARPGLDGHVADRHPALHREPLDHLARVLDDVADSTRDADPADGAEDDVLGRHAEGQLAGEEEAHRGGLALRQGLRREHVLHLGGPDAEGERPEGAVRGRVAVAAHDGHARLREAELRPDDVHDPLAPAAGRVERDAELGAVPLERLELRFREQIRDRPLLRGHVVVHRRDRQVGATHGASGHPEAVEGLRRGDLVDQMEVDEEQRRLAGGLGDDVAFPDLVEEGPGHGEFSHCAAR